MSWSVAESTTNRRRWTLRFFTVTAIVLVFLVSAPGCLRQAERPATGSITAIGSTALLPLVKQAAAEFMAKNPKVTINVSGGGSFTGLTQVASGAASIGNSDVFAPKDLARSKNLVDHQVAVAPFVIVVNPKVTVKSLTQEQLVSVFTGKTANWKEVGGPDLQITVVGRATSSGSRATIKEIVLKGREFTSRAVVQDSNGSVRAAIASTPGAVGYVDAAYLDSSIKPVAYNGVAYSRENVRASKYRIYAFEHMYTRGPPTGATKAFLDFIGGAEFQRKFVGKLGFIPIADLKAKPKPR